MAWNPGLATRTLCDLGGWTNLSVLRFPFCTMKGNIAPFVGLLPGGPRGFQGSQAFLVGLETSRRCVCPIAEAMHERYQQDPSQGVSW